MISYIVFLILICLVLPSFGRLEAELIEQVTVAPRKLGLANGEAPSLQ